MAWNTGSRHSNDQSRRRALVSEEGSSAPRRRRRRSRARSAATPVAQDPAPETPPGPSPAAAPRAKDAGKSDRGLRDLVGAGPSQLGVSGALRGRDVNRPTDQDLADAERDVEIIRRHWTPPER
jgi:hypothetical protein